MTYSLQEAEVRDEPHVSREVRLYGTLHSLDVTGILGERQRLHFHGMQELAVNRVELHCGGTLIAGTDEQQDGVQLRTAHDNIELRDLKKTAIIEIVVFLYAKRIGGEDMNYDKEMKVAELYGEIMLELGIKVTKDNAKTPLRVAKSLLEMTQNLRTPIEELEEICTTFENQYPGIRLEQKGIEYTSLCSHHHLPFMGIVNIEYEPSREIIGLSKFQRIVNYFSAKPQVQEEMTAEIGNFLKYMLDPVYLKVEVVDSIHTCMSCRGVKSSAKTSTYFEYRKPGMI